MAGICLRRVKFPRSVLCGKFFSGCASLKLSADCCFPPIAVKVTSNCNNSHQELLIIVCETREAEAFFTIASIGSDHRFSQKRMKKWLLFSMAWLLDHFGAILSSSISIQTFSSRLNSLSPWILFYIQTQSYLYLRTKW